MKKSFALHLSQFSKKAAAAAAVVAVSATSAMAAGLDLSADITAAKTDVITNGTAILGVVVAVVTFAWIRRVLK